MIENGTKQKLNSEIKLITPEIARVYLDSQIRNRHWRRDVIERYKAEMLAGTWHMNGQAIILNEDDQLIDGQHRLIALIEANKPIEMMVVSGVGRGLEKTIDTGKSRTLGDVFQMNRIRNGKLLARTSKLLLVWQSHFEELKKKGFFSKDLMNVPSQNVYDFYIKNKADIDRVCADFKKNTPIITNTGAPVLSFVFLILERIDMARCYAFITSFTGGKIRNDWNYMVQVRDHFLARTDKSKIRITESERISILFGVWNVVYHARPVQEVQEKHLNIPMELINP